MWEKDKQIVAKYRACMENFIAEVKSGEEPDYESACAVEAAQILKYAGAAFEHYQLSHPITISEKKQAYYTPRMPYFQNF